MKKTKRILGISTLSILMGILLILPVSASEISTKNQEPHPTKHIAMDGTITERKEYPDGSVKYLEINPDKNKVNENATVNSKWNTWTENMGSKTGSGYSISTVKVTGTYGMASMSFYADVLQSQDGKIEITAVYDSGFLDEQPSSKSRITQESQVDKRTPSSQGYAEASMKVNAKGDMYSGTIVLKLFVKQSGEISASIGPN